jgi:carboxyl-terminal processing protease
MTDLEHDGMRGLILDLRWCPGGFLNEAVNVAHFFLKESMVATVKSREGREVEYKTPAMEEHAADLPLVVLVNGSTSGGAELIAAAIQDHQRGRIAGQRTLGKASVQTPIELVDDKKLKLTTGTFIRPSGKNLHRFPDSKTRDDWGVRPDDRLEYRISADMDRQLREWWQLQSIRPGSSREILPLDDPSADPPRQAALEALLKMKPPKAHPLKDAPRTP